MSHESKRVEELVVGDVDCRFWKYRPKAGFPTSSKMNSIGQFPNPLLKSFKPAHFGSNIC